MFINPYVLVSSHVKTVKGKLVNLFKTFFPNFVATPLHANLG